MNATTRRVLRSEVLRGTAPVAAATFAVASVAMLLNETEDWVGRWVPFAQYVRVTLIVLVPLAVAAGAWQAGREHRRRTADQLASAARPPWQPVVLAWAAVTLGMFTGLLLAWGAAAATIAPVASYHNSSWPLTLAVGVAGIAAAASLGVVMGRLVRSRLVAPVAGLLVYIAVGVFSYEDGWRGVMLVPSLGYAGTGTSSLASGLQLRQLLWFGALTATLLVLGAARRWWPAAVPGALAAVLAASVVMWPVDERRVPDAAAAELVCTTDGGPEVCLARVNAFLLDDAVPAMRQQLARWEGIEGGFDRAVDSTPWYDSGLVDVPSDAVTVDVTRLISWNARLAETDEYGFGLADGFGWAPARFVLEGCGLEWAGDEPYYAATEAAAGWVRGGLPSAGVLYEDDGVAGGESEPPPALALLERPEAEQRAWMGRYLAAARDCDTAALTDLARELR
jgi:hypothetical protein